MTCFMNFMWEMIHDSDLIWLQNEAVKRCWDDGEKSNKLLRLLIQHVEKCQNIEKNCQQINELTHLADLCGSHHDYVIVCYLICSKQWSYIGW